MRNRILRPFSPTENIITANIYLDVLELLIIPQLQEYQPHAIYQQDGTLPHWDNAREFLRNKPD